MPVNKKNEPQCKHSWIQDAPIKVCYHCGYKPQNEPHVRDIDVPKNEAQLSEIYEPEYDLNDIVRELLVMMAETNPSNLKTCKYLLEEMDKWGENEMTEALTAGDYEELLQR